MSRSLCAGRSRTAEVASLAAVVVLAAASSPGVAAGRWQDDPIWNDGQAEVSVFQATETREGLPRDFTYVHVVVAEDLRRDTMVKTDSPAPVGGTVRVLKNNQLWNIPTGTYSFRQMASVYLDLADLRPVKETVSSHELCGNTFHHLLVGPSGAVLSFFSYFEGEGDRTFPLSFSGVQAADALPVALRALPFATGYSRSIRLLQTLVSNHGRAPVIRDGTVRVVGEETIDTGLGRIPAWKVEVSGVDGPKGASEPPGQDAFWFEKAPPRRLLRWERTNGGRYRLENSRRMKYWQLNRPGDEEKLFEKAESGTIPEGASSGRNQ